MTAGCPSAHVVYFCTTGARKARNGRRRLLRADDLEEEVGEEDVEDAGDGHAEGGEADEQRPVPGRARDSTGDTSSVVESYRVCEGRARTAAAGRRRAPLDAVDGVDGPSDGEAAPGACVSAGSERVACVRAGGVRWAGQRVVYMRCDRGCLRRLPARAEYRIRQTSHSCIGRPRAAARAAWRSRRVGSRSSGPQGCRAGRRSRCRSG